MVDLELLQYRRPILQETSGSLESQTENGETRKEGVNLHINKQFSIVRNGDVEKNQHPHPIPVP
jgi:hypothetical protein